MALKQLLKGGCLDTCPFLFMKGEYMPTKKAKTYEGKSLKKGGGGKFEKMKDAIMKTGKSEEAAKKITAAAGIKKYGKKEMNKMATAGRKCSDKK